jgi:hypothetical protein
VRLHTLTRWPRYAFPTPCAQQPPTPQILPFFLLVKDAPKPNPIKCGVMYGVWYIGTHKNIWCSHHQDLQRLKSVTFYLTDLLLSTKVGRQMARLSVASNVSFSPLKCKKRFLFHLFYGSLFPASTGSMCCQPATYKKRFPLGPLASTVTITSHLNEATVLLR